MFHTCRSGPFVLIGVSILLSGLLAGCGKKNSTIDCTTSYGAACLSLYDDFSTGSIDAAKWPIVTATEADDSVTVSGGELVTTVLDTTGVSPQRARVRFADESGIIAMAAQVRVDTYSLLDTATMKARLAGIFYSSTGTAVPNDATGDVLAEIEVFAGSVNYLVLLCGNSGCTSGNTTLIASQLAPATVGTANDLFIGWDGGTQFAFKVNGVASITVDANASGQAPDKGPPGLPFREVGVHFTNGTGAGDNIVAAFDNVQTAPAAQ